MIIESMVTYQALDDESDIHVHIPIIYPGSLENLILNYRGKSSTS